jgi:hypothetical protein
MQLIERYLEEFGTYLPTDLREGLVEELRSDLEEALEKRRAEEPNRAEDDLQVEILKEFGPPHELADTHVPRPRVLFGPRLYPPFIRTMKIAGAVLVALASIGVAVDFSRTQSLWALGQSLLSALGNILMSSLVILGIAVVVFALIERTAAAAPKDKQDWDPRSLPDAGDPDTISLADQVFTIASLVVALIVLNFYDRIGVAHVTWEDKSGWVPLLIRSFDLQLWLLNVALGLDLANFGVNCLYVYWLSRLAAGPVILAADPEWMMQNGWSAKNAAEYQEFISSTLSGIVDRILKIGFLAACIGLGFSFFKVVRRTIGGRALDGK